MQQNILKHQLKVLGQKHLVKLKYKKYFRKTSLKQKGVGDFFLKEVAIKKPKVFFVAQPTWGVDIGATKSIRNSLIDLANDGCGIIVISQDLEELFELADNICVLFRGKLSESKPLQELSSQKIGMLMGGEDLHSESKGR